MLHAILEALTRRGWDAQIVAVEHRGDSYEWNGIPVRSATDSEMGPFYTWCDMAITHLDITSHAMAWARYGRPLLHLIHNHRQLFHHHVPDNGRNLVIWNSDWVRYQSGDWKGPSIVCRPPTDSTRTATKTAKRYQLKSASLVNLLGEKGGPLFWRLARRRPDWKFIGVAGAYGYQTVPDPMPANGRLVRNGVDMRSVWKDTGVYLAPSWYESWGLAPVEALASGIPVIAHPTPGLLESLTSPEEGPCALFCDRDDDRAWMDILDKLEHREFYEEWSRKAILRAHELDEQSNTDLHNLNTFMRNILDTTN